jgi:hypothetical protein
MTVRTISLTADIKHPHDVPKIVEVLGRACAGLLLDGIESTVYSHQFDDAELETDELGDQ